MSHSSKYFDKYIGAEVMLPHNDNMLTGTVKRRKRDSDGTLKGTEHDNPLFDTRSYIIEFPDKSEKEFTATIIAENMYAQCTPDGKQFMLLEGITDHKTDEKAVDRADAYTYVNGRKLEKKTTKGWHLCVEWRDGTTSCETLSSLKESFPVEVAEYSVTAGISEEPAFKWWANTVLKKRNQIILKVKS